MAWTLYRDLIRFPFPFNQFRARPDLAILCKLAVKDCDFNECRLLPYVLIHFKALILRRLIILVEHFFNVHALFGLRFEIRGELDCVLLLLLLLVKIIIEEIKDSLVTLLFHLV
jgi:hypothetical protein